MSKPTRDQMQQWLYAIGLALEESSQGDGTFVELSKALNDLEDVLEDDDDTEVEELDFDT